MNEPHAGSTEYKLHLLLRPRRSSKAVAAASDDIVGSQHGRATHAILHGSADSEPLMKRTSVASSVSSTPTTESRQNRLQHLTTQLLWRLQQSSPYHSPSAADLVIPRLPEATAQLRVPQRPSQLLPGLESSQGALYEVGVADDGTLVGLSENEMSESLGNLRAMAASLGCNVEILRLVIVGDTESHGQGLVITAPDHNAQKEDLFVAEALVLPELHSLSFERPAIWATKPPVLEPRALSNVNSCTLPSSENEVSRTEQLRISLTGRTTAGKSSLLGTISTSTLDNGRGKSRLSLLKHRHEIATGMTSSVAPELIGYTEIQAPHENSGAVINYSSGNVSSWDDIHSSTGSGRLVFFTDSAGHPRYRRTIVRGLVSWAPHWTLCCIPANENVQGSGGINRGSSTPEIGEEEDITRSSFAHLGLCLKLRLPLIVVITKQDHATRDHLRLCLSNVLSMIKSNGRRPNLMVRPRPTSSAIDTIVPEDVSAAEAVFRESDAVPIILTSAVTGNGIGTLHALLRTAPILEQATPKGLTPPMLFHLDEIYSLPHNGSDTGDRQPENLVVASGYMRYGSFSVGDVVHIGPFLSETPNDMLSVSPNLDRTMLTTARTSGSPMTRSTPTALRSGYHGSYSPSPSTPTAIPLFGRFVTARIVSIRNLRLPVRRLLSDQVGTVGLEFPLPNQDLALKIRKGMILARTAAQALQSSSLQIDQIDTTLKACTSVQARFQEEDYEIMEPGAIFNVYIASVRAVAKIVTVEAVAPVQSHASSSHGLHCARNNSDPDSGDSRAPNVSHDDASSDEDTLSDLEETFEQSSLSSEGHSKGCRMIDVVFHFLYYAEWVEIGAKVLAMPSQTIAGGIGLDGFVGYVVETRE